MTLRCVTGRELAKWNLSVAGDNVTGEEKALTSGFRSNGKHELYETKVYYCWGHVCPSTKFLLEKWGRFVEFVNAVFRKKLWGGITSGPHRLCLTLTLMDFQIKILSVKRGSSYMKLEHSELRATNLRLKPSSIQCTIYEIEGWLHADVCIMLGFV
jgi:hypothetical protein